MAMEALRVIDTDSVFLPKSVTKSSLALLVFDIIDKLKEKNLEKEYHIGSMGVLIEEQEEDSIDVLSNENKVEEPPTKRGRHNILHGVHQTHLPYYTIGKRSIRDCAFDFIVPIDDSELFEF